MKNIFLVYCFILSTAYAAFVPPVRNVAPLLPLTFLSQMTSAITEVTNGSFGSPVALSKNGNHLVTAAVNLGIEAASDAGKVYVYEKSGENWVYQSTLETGSLTRRGYFGSNVGISDDGTTIVVGAENEYSDKNVDTGFLKQSGNAYVYTKSGANWVRQRLDFPNKGEESDFLLHEIGGVVISADGSRIVVAAAQVRDSGSQVRDLITPNTKYYSGSFYIFAKNGSRWEIEQYFESPDNSPVTYSGSMFAASISISDDATTLVAGKPFNFTYFGSGHSGETDKVLVYRRSGTVWSLDYTFMAPVNNKSFGESVLLSGDGNRIAISTREDGPLVLTPEVDSVASLTGRSDVNGWETTPPCNPCKRVYLTSVVNGKVRNLVVRNVTRGNVLLVYGTEYTWNNGSDRYYVKIGANVGATDSVQASYEEDTSLVEAGKLYIHVKDGATWATETEMFGAEAYQGFRLHKFSFSGDILSTNNSTTQNIYNRTGSSWTLVNSSMPRGDFSMTGDGSLIAIGHDEVVDIYGSDFNLKTTIPARTEVVPVTRKPLGRRAALSSDGEYVISSLSDWMNSAIIYHKENDIWVSTIINHPTDLGTGFGEYVAISGNADYAAISEPSNSRLFIYKRTGAIWSFEEEIIAPANSNGFAGNDNPDVAPFAFSVDGTRIIVTAKYGEGATNIAGKVFVYTRSGGVSTLEATLESPDGIVGPVDDDGFGTLASITGGGDKILVTDPGEFGKVYVFKRAGSTWSFQEKFESVDSWDDFGYGIALSDDGQYVAVGVKSSMVALSSTQGEIRIYNEMGNVWGLQETIIGPDVMTTDIGNGFLDDFARRLSFNSSGSLLMVTGVNTVDFPGAWFPPQVRMVYVYGRTASTWKYLRNVYRAPYSGAPDGGFSSYDNNSFGASIDMTSSGEFSLISSPDEDAGGVEFAGSLNVYKNY